jgi:hypothetical protein
MRGATILKATDDKTRALNSHTLMAFSGEAGDTSRFHVPWLCTRPCMLTALLSPIRRVHPSKRSAVLHAQRCGSVPIGVGTLCERGVGIKSAVTEAVHSQPPARRRRSYHPQAKPLLARLPRGAGTSTVRRSRLRSVCLRSIVIVLAKRCVRI